jgi:peptide/nickel transport system substrate-binding protein
MFRIPRYSLSTAASALAAFSLAAAPAAAQTMRIGAAELPPSAGDPTTSLTRSSVFVWQAMFNAVAKVDNSGKAQPILAESWQNLSPTTWRVKMRPGVKFHNAEPLTADALVDAVNNLISDEGKAKGGPVYGTLRPLAGAKKIDDMTVEITTSVPTPTLMADMGALMIVAPKAWQSLGREGFARNPAGTGPFQQVSWSDSKVKWFELSDTNSFTFNSSELSMPENFFPAASTPG